MSFFDAIGLHTDSGLHISGGSFNQVAGNHNEYNIFGNLIHSYGENGIHLLQRSISGDAFYNSEKRSPPPRCHPDTRTAVQDTIESWAADTDYRAPPVMWLYGPAGAGKSAVAQTMAENWAGNNELAAAFFFARWRAGGDSGKPLFPTIAYQLALHIPSLREFVGLAIEADPAICDKALEEQVHALIIQPFGHLQLERSWPYLIIIDGLDECDSKPMQSRIIKLIFKALVEDGLPFRFLICSRPEPHIRETFDSLPGNVQFRRLVLDETFNPGCDILRFLRDRFSAIRRKRLPYLHNSWPSERDLETLVHSASGQFIYAATVVKFVDDEYCHPVEQLSAVLSLSGTETDTCPFADLDRLYAHILSANPNTTLLMRILGTYFAIPNPDMTPTHCVGFLNEILGLQHGSVRFALRGLHSLLFIPDVDDDRIRVHHASLHDFLSSPGRAGRFYLSNQVRHMELARRCLSIVLVSVRHPERFTVAVLEYAHNYYAHHYIPVLEQHAMIQECLRCFREILCPTEVNLLCYDAEALPARFMRIVNFLNSLGNGKDMPATLSQDLDDTWDILLKTLFKPTPEFYEAWISDLHRCSSLGMVFQTLWGEDPNVAVLLPFDPPPLTMPAPQSRQRIMTFLRNNPSAEIQFTVAEISLRLVMCRTAEMWPWAPYSLYRYKRYSTHWAFASQWCTYLVQAPATTELLAMLRGFIKMTIIVPKKEINCLLIRDWLRAFGTPDTEIYRTFERASIIESDDGKPRDPLVLISFPPQ